MLARDGGPPAVRLSAGASVVGRAYENAFATDCRNVAVQSEGGAVVEDGGAVAEAGVVAEAEEAVAEGSPNVSSCSPCSP